MRPELTIKIERAMQKMRRRIAARKRKRGRTKQKKGLGKGKTPASQSEEDDTPPKAPSGPKAKKKTKQDTPGGKGRAEEAKAIKDVEQEIGKAMVVLDVFSATRADHKMFCKRLGKNEEFKDSCETMVMKLGKALEIDEETEDTVDRIQVARKSPAAKKQFAQVLLSDLGGSDAKNHVTVFLSGLQKVVDLATPMADKVSKMSEAMSGVVASKAAGKVAKAAGSRRR